MMHRAVPGVVLAVTSLVASACGRANFVPLPADAAGLAMDAPELADAAVDARVVSPDAPALPGPDASHDAFSALDAHTPADVAPSIDAVLTIDAHETPDAIAPIDARSAPDATTPDAGSGPLLEDCSHRWRRTTNLSANFKMYASDVTVAVAGFVTGGGARTDGHDEAAGGIAWSRPGVGPFGGGAAEQYAVFQNTGGGAARYGVLDMRTGTDVNTFTHFYDTTGWSSWRLSVRDDAESLLVTQATPAGPAWSLTATGAGTLMGPGPATLLFRHAADGSYRGHVQVADANVSPSPLRVGAAGWGLVISGESAPVTLGAHVVPAGAHEVVVLTDDLSFDRAHTFPDPISGAVTLPASGVLAARAGGRLVGFDGPAERWSRPDCPAGSLAASRSRLYLATQLGPGTSSHCGATTASAAGSRILVVELDPSTGVTLAAQWFAVSTGGMRAFAVSGDGDAYVAITADASVCGEAGTGTSAENFLIAL